MRTTVAIDDELLAAAKRRAGERGVSLGTVVEDALRRELAQHRTRHGPALPTSGEGGLRPGVDLTSNAALYELLDEGVPVERLR